MPYIYVRFVLFIYSVEIFDLIGLNTDKIMFITGLPSAMSEAFRSVKSKKLPF